MSSTFFIRKIFRMTLPIDQENSEYFMTLGIIALSHYGDAFGL
jgi:hypothetical protein